QQQQVGYPQIPKPIVHQQQQVKSNPQAYPVPRQNPTQPHKQLTLRAKQSLQERQATPRETAFQVPQNTGKFDVPCYRCDEAESSMECVDCYAYFCGDCCSELHMKGQWKAHEVYPLYD